MVVDLGIEFDKKQEARLLRTLRRATTKIKNDLERRWNNSALDFRRLMQDQHLEGGTTADKLARRTSTLYSSLRHEVKLTRDRVNVSVWFLDSVRDYAPTHEFGDAGRNIPARMNMAKEWKKFNKRFDKDANEAVSRGLRNA